MLFTVFLDVWVFDFFGAEVFAGAVGCLSDWAVSCFFNRSRRIKYSDLTPNVIITLNTNKNSVQIIPKKKLNPKLFTFVTYQKKFNIRKIPFSETICW